MRQRQLEPPQWRRQLAGPIPQLITESSATALVGVGHLTELAGDLDGADAFHRRTWRTQPGPRRRLSGSVPEDETAGQGMLLGRADRI
jgi:hypothetical protein